MISLIKFVYIATNKGAIFVSIHGAVNRMSSRQGQK